MIKKHPHKRPFLMLEVMIALIVFCAIPLISPHIMMVKAQKLSINEMNINHAVNLVYVNILEKMHKNEIPLNDIEGKTLFEVPSQDLKQISGYKATYQFIEEKHKKRNADNFTVHLATLQIKFIPHINTGKILSYQYEVFLGSKLLPGTDDTNTGAEDDEEYESQTT